MHIEIAKTQNRRPNNIQKTQPRPQSIFLDDFKMADRREKTLAKTSSRGTKSPKLLEIFITWLFEKLKWVRNLPSDAVTTQWWLHGKKTRYFCWRFGSRSLSERTWSASVRKIRDNWFQKCKLPVSTVGWSAAYVKDLFEIKKISIIGIFVTVLLVFI